MCFGLDLRQKYYSLADFVFSNGKLFQDSRSDLVFFVLLHVLNRPFDSSLEGMMPYRAIVFDADGA